MKIVIIIPTYNERENIQKLIPEILSTTVSLPHDINILVVDDNSPDGTGNVVIDFIKQYSTVHLLTGEKQGLGVAYIRGMNYAIKTLNADAVMEMDADFSHKPEDVPRLIEKLDSNDFVIGSRYVTGGKITDEWSLFRRLNSWGGNIAARYIAGLKKIKDCTAGFRAIRTEVLENIDFSLLEVKGYSFQINLLHKALLAGARVKEVPVEFVDRTVGESKLGLKDILEFLYAVWIIRLESSKTFIKFAIVGLSGLFVNLLSLTWLLNEGMNKYIASPISIELSIISNFLLNNYWTFRHRENTSKLHIKGLKFNFVSIVSLAISYSTFVLIMFIFPKTIPQLAQAIGVVPAILTNYLSNAYWTFRESKIKRSGWVTDP